MNGSNTFAPAAKSPRSLYVHVPFCRHRCGYCNFALVANRDDLIERYLNALETEIGWLAARHAVETVFIGGGTPSQLNAKQLHRLVSIIASKFDLSTNVEFSIECNPNDLGEVKARAFADCGVNRISFGVQSFNDHKLKKLERDHSASDVSKAVELAREVTKNVSFDLIFAAPGETLQDWVADLDTALSFSPTHLSTYELTIEKGTQFWNRRHHGSLVVPDEDTCAKMYETTIQLASSNGLDQYEISSFATTGYQCRHNKSYWTGNEYFAFGPGAARFIDGVRETNHRSTSTYLKMVESNRSPVTEREVLTPRAQALDRIVFGLRQSAGFSLSAFDSQTQMSAIDLLGSTGDWLKRQNLLLVDGDSCRLTERGFMVYDGIAAKILANEPVIPLR